MNANRCVICDKIIPEGRLVCPGCERIVGKPKKERKKNKMDANSIKDTILAMIAAIGAAITNALGGWDTMLALLVSLMAADYITGLAVAGVFKRSTKSESGALDSGAGFRGLVKKCAILLLVYIAVLLDKAVGTHYVRAAVALFFVGNEGLSLLENIGLMGVEYPAFLKNMLQALREKGDGGKDGDGDGGVQ